MWAKNTKACTIQITQNQWHCREAFWRPVTNEQNSMWRVYSSNKPKWTRKWFIDSGTIISTSSHNNMHLNNNHSWRPMWDRKSCQHYRRQRNHISNVALRLLPTVTLRKVFEMATSLNINRKIVKSQKSWHVKNVWCSKTNVRLRTQDLVCLMYYDEITFVWRKNCAKSKNLFSVGNNIVMKAQYAAGPLGGSL